MHKAFGYILILMIGLAVGFFVGAIVSFPSSSQLGTEKQLKLVDIECVQSNYPLLRIILKLSTGQTVVFWTYWNFCGHTVKSDLQEKGHKIRYLNLSKQLFLSF